MSHTPHPNEPFSTDESPVNELLDTVEDTDIDIDVADEASEDDAMERDTPEALGKDAIAAFAEQTPVGAVGKKRAKAGKRSRLPVLLAAVGALIVLVGVVLLLVFVFTPPEEEPAPPSPDTSVVLVDKPPPSGNADTDSSVKSIHVTSRLDEFTLAINDDGVFALTDSGDLPINSTNVKALVSSFERVVAEKAVVTDPPSFADYGLDDPTATVEVVYTDGVTILYELASLAVGDRYYLRIDKGDTVYLMDASLPEQVMQTAEAFIGLSMIAPPSVGSTDAGGSVVVKELSLTGTVRDKKIVTLRRKESSDSGEFENSSYLLTEPYLSDTDSTVVSGISSATSLIASDIIALHPTEAQLEEYGLKDPYSVAKVVLAVYTYTTDNNGEVATEGYYNETPHIILLGNKDDNGNYYAMVDTADVVYQVSPESVPWAEKTYHDFANQYLFLRNLTTLSSITYTTGGKTYEFKLEHFPEESDLDAQLRVTMGGTQYPTDQFRELYKVMMTLYRTGPAPAEPQGDPLLTVRIVSTDTSYSAKEISIYSYSGSVYIARAENGDTYKVTASRVDDAIAQLNNFLNGELVINRY